MVWFIRIWTLTPDKSTLVYSGVGGGEPDLPLNCSCGGRGSKLQRAQCTHVRNPVPCPGSGEDLERYVEPGNDQAIQGGKRKQTREAEGSRVDKGDKGEWKKPSFPVDPVHVVIVMNLFSSLVHVAFWGLDLEERIVSQSLNTRVGVRRRRGRAETPVQVADQLTKGSSCLTILSGGDPAHLEWCSTNVSEYLPDISGHLVDCSALLLEHTVSHLGWYRPWARSQYLIAGLLT